MNGRQTPDFFYSPTDGKLLWDEVFVSMVKFMGADTEADYDIIIGTDSKAGLNGSKSRYEKGTAADFVSVIIVHKKGSGGIYFWSKQAIERIYSLKQRMQMEALRSLALAERATEELMSLGLVELNLGIHLDIGPNGPTKDFIAELEGMIKANGFRVATKPASWGASHVADRHV